MSSQDSEQIASYASIILNNYCIICSAVFFLYDYLITFDREVDSFWHGATSGATVLFLSNRYLNVSLNILGMVEFGQFSDTVGGQFFCTKFARALAILTILAYIPWAVFSGLRAYALCLHKLPSALVFLLSLVPLGINAARIGFNLTGTDDPVFGCFASNPVPDALQLKTCLIASDFLIIVMTWRRLPRNTLSFDTLHKARLSVTCVLMRDGIVYFGVLMVLNVLHLAFSLRSMFGFTDDSASNLTAFTEPATAVLVSRFLLDLQEANRADVVLHCSLGELSTYAESGVGSINFARVVGSIGSTIGPGLPHRLKTARNIDESRSASESFELYPPVAPSRMDTRLQEGA
ncbi:hypothetical protein C8Q74DRAFT_1365947 [Fomes fomentarius]|nr:hypothetical protein C8Q74DRAFT_1365947 [Fomes fomentarius]